MKEADKPKTPGEVAYEAYMAADDASFPEHQREKLRKLTWKDTRLQRQVKWEAAAQAVRKQLAQEMKALRFEPGPAIAEALGRVRNIRRLVSKFIVALVAPGRDHPEEDKDDLINAIVAILDGPTPEAAGACAETADAEQSKSPPPAER